MNIKRAKGVKKLRIVGHNKKLFYWILFLFALLVGVLILIRILQ